MSEHRSDEAPTHGHLASSSSGHGASGTQHGEDVIVRDLLRKLSEVCTPTKWCVDVGAWDGVYLSNTRALVIEDGFSAIMIEADPLRCSQIPGNYVTHRVKAICALAARNGEFSLDSLLSQTEVPRDFDFLSIDIDGMDYWILDGLHEYRPRVVCIEYNPTIPNGIFFVQPDDGRIQWGSSATALAQLAAEKHFVLVAATLTNLFLLDEAYAETVLGSGPYPALDQVRQDHSLETTIFSGYDGTVFAVGNRRLPWHGYELQNVDLQVIPAFLRRYPGSYTRWQKVLLKTFIAVRSPEQRRRALRLLVRRIKQVQ